MSDQKFKLRIKKQVHGCFASCSTMDIYLYHDFELPFAPFIGLSLLDGENEFKVETELYWNVDSQSFIGYAEEDKEIYNAQLHHYAHRPIEEIVKAWEENGWKRED